MSIDNTIVNIHKKTNEITSMIYLGADAIIILYEYARLKGVS